MSARAIRIGFGLLALTVGCGGDQAEEEKKMLLDAAVEDAGEQESVPDYPFEKSRPLSAEQEKMAIQRLAGRYAHYDVVAYESSDMKTLIISYGFTDLTERDGKLIASESFCASEHRSDQPVTTKLSDEATQAIKPKSIAVTLGEIDGKVHLWRAETPTALGIELDNPETDSLPKDPKDARPIDSDGDGKPGVTVTITVTEDLKGELYIARREIFAYGVLEQPDGSLVGKVSDHSEQLILGASAPIFAMASEWFQVKDLSKSPIILKPVTADWDCERLMQERPTLFPPTPEVDW